MSRKIKAAVFNVGEVEEMFDRVFAQGRRGQLEELVDLYPAKITDANLEEHMEGLHDLEVIFSTWNMLELTKEQLARLPRLKAVFYAAGDTRYFCGPFLNAGIAVCCAAAANGVPVAEFALAQVLLAGAGAWRNRREYIDKPSYSSGRSYRGGGNFGGRVAVLGDGNVSRHLQGLLFHFNLEAAVVSSWEDRRTVSLEEAFSTAFAVVNVFPDLGADNAGVLDGGLFRRMPDGAVFINVGRGQQVNEEDLIAVMKERTDLTALLDVTWPEPPDDGSELHTLPNVELTAHLAGSKASEFVRLADSMIKEFLRYEKGEPLRHQVQPNQL